MWPQITGQWQKPPFYSAQQLPLLFNHFHWRNPKARSSSLRFSGWKFLSSERSEALLQQSFVFSSFIQELGEKQQQIWNKICSNVPTFGARMIPTSWWQGDIIQKCEKLRSFGFCHKIVGTRRALRKYWKLKYFVTRCKLNCHNF